MKANCLKVLAGAVSMALIASAVTVDVSVSRPGHEVPASLWGIFLEDIALSVDGCLYPELVWNRGFEFRPAPSDDGFEKRLKGPTDLGIPGWTADCRRTGMGRFTLQYAKPLRADTPAYLRMEAFAPFAGVRNTGPMGEMDVKGGVPLNLSFYARGDVPLIVRVESADNKILCEKHFHPKDTWKKFAAVVTPKASAKKAHLLILAAKAGTAEIDYVSLMPAKTFKGHGLREDIAQLIADLKPANFRFPGGCMLESCDYAGWFDWKRTVGAPETRQPLWNIWGYYQNVGLGFYEYFVFCEDIGAEPLPVFIGGRTCQFRNSKLFPKENLGWLVTNMLDAVEFIRGPTNTTWGALRAKMGHPAPFPLKTIGIGNENWGKEYYSRFYPLAAGVKAVHPDLKVIAAIDPHVIRDPSRGKESWAEIRKGEVDFADEHMYASPSYWLNHTDRYDSYPRDNVPVYIGEWGTRDIRPDWIDGLYVSLAEAAFRIGIEKNSDVVKMVAYAPLARRRGAPRDGFSLLDVTTDAVCGNPTYYAEKMFTHNRPDRIVPVSYPKVTNRQPAGWDREKGPFNPKGEAIDVVAFHAGAGLAGGELVVKLVNAAPDACPVTLAFDMPIPAGKVSRETLCGEPGAKNTPEEPLRVVPRKDELLFTGGRTMELHLPPYSFTILRLRSHDAAVPDVVLPDSPTAVEKSAANELADELGKCLGMKPAIVSEGVTRKERSSSRLHLYVGATRASAEARSAVAGRPPYQVDEVFLKSVGDGVVLDGDPARAPIYAVDLYLEKYCGVRWWTSNAATYPKLDVAPVAGINLKYAPQFKYRETYYLDGFDPLFKVRSKGNFSSLTRYMLSDMKFVPPELGGNHRLYFFKGRHSAYHSFFEVLPPKTYFKKHPEWYSLVDGKRQPKQLCLANAEMKAEYIKETLKRLREDSSVDFIQVSQNDWYGFCQCEACTKMMDEDGGVPSGPYLRFANEVAEAVEKEFPKVRVDTFAYQFTRKAPAKTRPRHNVVVRLCDIECDFARPLADASSPLNVQFAKDIADWKRVAGGNLFIWDYLANFWSYMLPHPNILQIAPNIRLFAENGVVGVFEQGDALCSAGSFATLRHYLSAHLLWDPEDDENRLMDEFLAGYYGKSAAPFLKKFIRIVEDGPRKTSMMVGCGHKGVSFLTAPDKLLAAKTMDEAVAAAAKEGDVFATRVRRERLSVDQYLLLNYDLLRKFAASNSVPWTRPETRAEAVENWIREVKAFGVKARRETTSADEIESYFAKLRDEKGFDEFLKNGKPDKIRKLPSPDALGQPPTE